MGSLAISAPPVALRRGATATELLPERGVLSSRSSNSPAGAPGRVLADRRLAGLQRPVPQRGEAWLAAALEQREIVEPGKVGAGEAAADQKVAEGEWLRLDAQQRELRRRLRHPLLVAVQAVDERLHPDPGLLGHAALPRVDGAAVVDDADGMVEIAGQRPGHLRDAAV